jgi:hypothetical protein
MCSHSHNTVFELTFTISVNAHHFHGSACCGKKVTLEGFRFQALRIQLYQDPPSRSTNLMSNLLPLLLLLMTSVFEIGSCQSLYTKTRMLESSMCSACKFLGRYDRKYYKKHGYATKGVCHKLHPHLAPASAVDQENIGILNQDRNEEESEFQLLCLVAVPFHFKNTLPDEKGGLKFSFAKRDTSGMLLSVDQIQSFISTSTQKKKKVDKANGVRSEKEVTEDSMVQEVVNAENP